MSGRRRKNITVQVQGQRRFLRNRGVKSCRGAVASRARSLFKTKTTYGGTGCSFSARSKSINLFAPLKSCYSNTILMHTILIRRSNTFGQACNSSFAVPFSVFMSNLVICTRTRTSILSLRRSHRRSAQDVNVNPRISKMGR